MKKSMLVIVLGLIFLLGTGTVVAEVVNINKASAEEIALRVKGIGMKKAQAIVAYRKSHGEFKSVEDLTKVGGIGVKMLEKIKNMITLKTGKSSKKR